MRWCGLWLVVMAACGADEGALLTVRAPDGPAAAARLEIVLANADPRTISEIDGQRVAPGMLDGEAVRYYRQRATGGELAGVAALDGFVLRLEPNLVAAPDAAFIPFLIAYDEQDQVIGIGAVLDGNGDPVAITVVPDTITKYQVDMIAVTPADASLGLGDRESMVVSCGADGARWQSGLAWKPTATSQLRLLRADASADPAAIDASARATDLDCDGHVAPDEDCDDLRPRFHAGGTETCDGLDMNCDGDQTLVVACPNAADTCGGEIDRGVQLCDDATGEPLTACTPDAACKCAGGATGCNQCVLGYRATADAARQVPCAPAVGKLQLLACTEQLPCSVAVVASDPAWKAFLSTDPTTGFTTQLTGVTGPIYLEVKLVANGGEVTAAPRGSIGAVYLAVTQGAQVSQVGVALVLDEASSDQCTPLPGTTLSSMACTP